MLKKYGVTCLILFASFVPFGSASAVIIGFSPDSSTFNVGDTFDVDVVISDLAGEIVTTYDLDVLYDETMLLATNVQFSTSLGDEFFFEVFNVFFQTINFLFVLFTC